MWRNVIKYMDIKSGQLSTLLLDVEKVRRRKVVDYKSEQDIKYIDLADNLKTLNISNNHLIFGRRGSVKTTLILASVKRNDNIVTAIDVQSMKNDNSLNIIIKIMLQVLFDVQENFRGYFNEIETKYKIQYKGVRGFGCWLLRKRDKEIIYVISSGAKFSFRIKSISFFNNSKYFFPSSYLTLISLSLFLNSQHPKPLTPLY